MVPHPLWILVALALASAAEAQDVHTCMGPDGVTYQSAPCAAGDQEQAFAPVGSGARQRDGSSMLRARQRNRYAGTPFAAKTLTIGMTDTQVLNLPGWGRPDQIQRTRSKRAWREQWTYQGARSDHQFLYFENGRLVSREEPPMQWMQVQTAEQ